MLRMDSVPKKRLTFAIIVVLIVSIAGCAEVDPQQAVDLFQLNTLFKSYVVMPDGKNPVNEFADYEIGVHLQAVRSLDLYGTNNFRVSLESFYKPRVGYDDNLEHVNLLSIDSMAVRLIADDSLLYPALLFSDFEETKTKYEVQYNHLLGPRYRYDTVLIPERYLDVELSYVAKLVDRSTGSVLQREKIQRTLHRVEIKKYYQPRY